MPTEARIIQRALTIELIAKRRLNATAIWLNPESAAANADDATRESHKLNTPVEDWQSPNDDRNMAVRLVDGFVELQIASPDDIWARNFFEACASLKVDARFAYGARGRPITSIILHADRPEKWGDRWPRGHRDKGGQWVETKIAYSPAASKPVYVHSRPLPGSIFANDLMVWRPLGKPAADDGELGLEDLEARQMATTSMESICRAVAFATLGYWIGVYLDGLDWDQSLTRTIGGWIARQIREGADINARGKSLEGVCWAPVDSLDSADDLLRYCLRLGAGRELRVAFEHADSALDRNRPVAGWPAIETLFGPHARVGIRRAFRAGLDIDVIERMSEQYVLDTSEHIYIDRETLLKGVYPYFHKQDDLVRQWDNESLFVGGKPQNPFRLYARSSLRTDVLRQEFLPGSEPGAILRFSPVYGLVSDDERRADEYVVLNNFGGFHIKPVSTIDQAVMREVGTMLDRMLALLTQDNAAQMKWLKQFIAWIRQHPEVKAQVCPIIVGGQGIGKSMFGNELMKALFGNMAGGADAGSLSDNKFMITPFVRKLITFIDEVHLENAAAINQIKKIVRADYVSGQNKFENQKDHYIPSRLLIASNDVKIGLRSEDAADRCFFFIIAYTYKNKKMTVPAFQAWAQTLKPFFDIVDANLKNVVFRQHLARYFMDIEVTRAELEDLTCSSHDDEDVVLATMSKEREIARAIVGDARVQQGLDITAWFNTQQLREAIKRIYDGRNRVEASLVLAEYEQAGVLEKEFGDNYKFKYKYGTLLEKLGEAHGLAVPPNWRLEPDDFGANDVLSMQGGREWRGYRQSKAPRQRRDLDAMPDF